jgi:hypothetical protein
MSSNDNVRGAKRRKKARNAKRDARKLKRLIHAMKGFDPSDKNLAALAKAGL